MCQTEEEIEHMARMLCVFGPKYSKDTPKLLTYWEQLKKGMK